MANGSVNSIRAIRVKGWWSAHAGDGVNVGQGSGKSWDDAVSDAIRALDAQRPPAPIARRQRRSLLSYFRRAR